MEKRLCKIRCIFCFVYIFRATPFPISLKNFGLIFPCLSAMIQRYYDGLKMSWSRHAQYFWGIAKWCKIVLEPTLTLNRNALVLWKKWVKGRIFVSSPFLQIPISAKRGNVQHVKRKKWIVCIMITD